LILGITSIYLKPVSQSGLFFRLWGEAGVSLAPVSIPQDGLARYDGARA
jgi:hypothetical protein